MDPFTLAALIGGGSSILGGIIGGAGQAKASEADRRHQVEMLMAQLSAANGQFEQGRQDDQGALGLKTANTAPDRVAWRQNQAIQSAIMPGLRNFSVKAPMGMEQYVPQMSGGFKIPEGGFDQNTLKFFGDDAMLQGEMDLDRQGSIASNGRYATPSYGSIYGSPQAAAGESAANTASANLRKIDEEAAAKRKQGITSGPGSQFLTRYQR